ncbi:glutamate--tRNA ligase [Fusibacter sp. A1]|nr:glutamate--tRNA ligase [Fusibacter sp. A1]RXV58872.1 glutamate--tRNA ligase [Fusibacter sp. A1]
MAALLFSNLKYGPEDYEMIYSERNLPEGAMVTRFAPSPTGTLHIGHLIGSLLDVTLARQTGGASYLRIEDTDKKRSIEGSVQSTIDVLEYYGITFDEGATGLNDETGDYGPYKQSQRTQIYHTFVKRLIEQGHAYPCFCTETELSEVRKKQEADKLITGYYGEFAKCREMSFEDVKKRIERKDAYVIRLKSNGNLNNEVVLNDIIRGAIRFPENNLDMVLLKSDGVPTYHFAHAVDDHLMRTTHVIRADEWLPSFPLHKELFDVLGWKPPNYIHISPIMKSDGKSKRKLSKRKDPESALTFYLEDGYPSQSVIEYLLNLINSNYEEWRACHPLEDSSAFIVDVAKMSSSGSVFDFDKFVDVSKQTIARMSAESVYDQVWQWSLRYDNEFAELMGEHKHYMTTALGIERGGEKPRKDIAKWSDVKEHISYFFDELFCMEKVSDELARLNMQPEEVVEILKELISNYTQTDSHEEWYEQMKNLCERLGYATSMKEFKRNKEVYRGHLGDLMGMIRLVLTGRRNTPDLYQIMSTMGIDRVTSRMDNATRMMTKR